MKSATEVSGLGGLREPCGPRVAGPAATDLPNPHDLQHRPRDGRAEGAGGVSARALAGHPPAGQGPCGDGACTAGEAGGSPARAAVPVITWSVL